MIAVYKIKFFQLLKTALKVNSKLEVLFLNNEDLLTFALRFKIFLLRIFNVASIETRHFYLKDFVDDNGSAVQFGLLEEAESLSLELSFHALRELGLENTISVDFFRNLQIHLAQCYHNSIVTTLREIALVEKLSIDLGVIPHLYTDYRLTRHFRNKFNHKDTQFYNDKSVIALFKLLAYFSLYYCSLWTGVFLFRSSKNLGAINTESRLKNSNSILAFTTELITPSIYLRNEISWYFSDMFSDISLFCFTKFDQKEEIIQLDSSTHQNVFLVKLKLGSFRKFRLFKTSLSSFISIANSIFSRSRNLLDLCSKLFTFKEFLGFLWDLESYKTLIKQLNCKLFVYHDAYFRETHVFNTLAEFGFVKSIEIQYSNVALRSIVNLSNPTIALTFSNHFNQFFESPTFGIGPKSFISVGYPFCVTDNKLNFEARRLRDELSRKKVKYVVGYFDESIQADSDIWAFKTMRQHLDDIHEICKLVLNHSDIGVIYKTQFMRNIPYRLYPDDTLIKSAVDTGRLIFPQAGFHRNITLPSEIALASDLCIGDLVGATASLESAMAGSKSILIDTMNFGPKYRGIYYASSSLVYKSLSQAFAELEVNRDSNSRNENFGNWTNVFINLDLMRNAGNDILSERIKVEFDEEVDKSLD
jgi:hypothetical protein